MKEEGRKLKEEEGHQADETPWRKRENRMKMKTKEKEGKTRNKWKIMCGKIEKNWHDGNILVIHVFEDR